MVLSSSLELASLRLLNLTSYDPALTAVTVERYMFVLPLEMCLR